MSPFGFSLIDTTECSVGWTHCQYGVLFPEWSRSLNTGSFAMTGKHRKKLGCFAAVMLVLFAVVAREFALSLRESENRLSELQDAALFLVPGTWWKGRERAYREFPKIEVDVKRLSEYADDADYERYGLLKTPFKGYSLLVGKTADNQTIKVRISYYACFYQIVGQPGIWTLKDSGHCQDWADYVNSLHRQNK